MLRVIHHNDLSGFAVIAKHADHGIKGCIISRILYGAGYGGFICKPVPLLL